MQIDRYNHLLFPRDNNSAPAAKGGDASAGAATAAAAKPQAKPPAPAVVPERAAARPEGVVLKIQWPDDDKAMARAEAPVYSNARKVPAHEPPGVEVQAEAHQRAVDRNAGVFTQITLNKDGVLVAKPTSASEGKPADFVALAVSAMREFSDEAERVKIRSTEPISAPADNMNWGKLKGLQQLAAKFNVFT
ncbi:MAG: hypothetical protein V4858_20980 [Pseudomonadota bacterium]